MQNETHILDLNVDWNDLQLTKTAGMTKGHVVNCTVQQAG